MIKLVESIQKNLGYPELHKIDPNTQEVKQAHRTLGQAAIPAVLMGLYKFGSTELGAKEILRGNMSTSWLEVLFGDRKDEAIQKVASYAGNPGVDVGAKMEEIAIEAVRLIREKASASSHTTFLEVKSSVVEQRNNILHYLPAELQIGYLLRDNTLDDRTNKMEGPISSGLHFLEKLFSGSSSEKYERDEKD